MSTAGRQIVYFISYTQSDLGWAQWLDWVLQKANYKTIVQFRDCRPGHDFMQFMREASRRADRTACLLTNAYLASAYGQQELNAALVTDPLGVERRLIPIRVEDCSPEELLRGRTYVDLVGVEQTALIERLLAGLSDAPTALPSVAPPIPIGNLTDDRSSGTVKKSQAELAPGVHNRAAANDLEARSLEIQRSVECDDADQALNLLMDFVRDFAKDRSLLNKVILLKRNYRRIVSAQPEAHGENFDFDTVMEKTGEVLLEALNLMDQVVYGRAA